ncbi:hypothetical protein D9V29_05770 [Mycetocola manganoxydans]|uniref:Fimbrial assembly protein n=1 Tax=Mycetocola manganoxydans TaxID=699879 RepID=A0A3L6ZWI5_9MICO|nr:hypothetical protein [Mycetocola manganoxydans]RLP71941.1 hypothetical protein D9V29_05770 [Mycetocola manganoxydans]GHD47212.1 hypothetical protein GCM10008097_17860 [Mycetocola manganoxydans]
MSKINESLIVGGAPRADLLPPEIRQEHKGKRTRRKLIWGVLGVVLLVFVGTGASYYLSLTSAIQLVAAQERTNELLVEQQKYTEVRVVQDELASVEAGQRVGAATEVDWKAYIDKIEASLPDNVLIMEVTIDAASPLTDYEQPDAPLLGMRVATLRFGAWTSALPDTDAWLVALSALPGHADANPDSIEFDDDTRLYETYVTMHIDERAWSERFISDEEKAAKKEAKKEAADAEKDAVAKEED